MRRPARALSYYRLSPLGHRLLHGEDVAVPSKRAFAAVGLARQHHTFSLAEFLVHLFVAAHGAGMRVVSFFPENALALSADGQVLYPDASFQLVLPSGVPFSYHVELDNSSERIRSERSLDSWERKITLYDRIQAQADHRFRVLVISTRSHERLHHILSAAGDLLAARHQTLFCGVHLPEYLASNAPLTERCFRDQALAPIALVRPRVTRREIVPLPSPPPAPAWYDARLAVASERTV